MIDRVLKTQAEVMKGPYLKEKEYRFNHRNLIGEDFVNKMLEMLLNRAEFTP